MPAMSDESQAVLPASFIALYLEPGRAKPNALRGEIGQRYEFCEDLATLLVDHAQTKLWELGVTAQDVLERTHSGLLSEPSNVTPAEAEWVMRRLAELLGWDGARPVPR
jgi:hypothetical protein